MTTRETGDAATEPDLAPGTMFGRYRIVRALRSGSMGAVYEAQHADLKKRVALKTLGAGLARDPVACQRFLREGRIASQIEHPHVVTITDFGVHEGVPFLVMELLSGESLGDAIERAGPLPVARVAQVMLPVVAALAAAHDAGVVHRDIKPHNIFLARARTREVVKVLDFGISKSIDRGEDDTALTLAGTLMGTPYYMSPEQARSGKVGPASDQYALGAVMYECATGQVPFEADNLLALLHAIGSAPLRPPRALRPELPATFERVVMRAMAREPSERYGSMRDLGCALLEFADKHTRGEWEPELDVLGEGPTLHQDAPALAGGGFLAPQAQPAPTVAAAPAALVATALAEGHASQTLSPRVSRRARGPRRDRSGLVLGASVVALLVAVVALGAVLLRRASASSGPPASHVARGAPSLVVAGAPAAPPAAPPPAAPVTHVAAAAIGPDVSAPDTASPRAASAPRSAPARRRAMHRARRGARVAR